MLIAPLLRYEGQQLGQQEAEAGGGVSGAEAARWRGWEGGRGWRLSALSALSALISSKGIGVGVSIMSIIWILGMVTTASWRSRSLNRSTATTTATTTTSAAAAAAAAATAAAAAAAIVAVSNIVFLNATAAQSHNVQDGSANKWRRDIRAPPFPSPILSPIAILISWHISISFSPIIVNQSVMHACVRTCHTCDGDSCTVGDEDILGALRWGVYYRSGEGDKVGKKEMKRE